MSLKQKIALFSLALCTPLFMSRFADAADQLHTVQPKDGNVVSGDVTAAAAASGSWSSSIGGPNLFNTNIVVSTADITPPTDIASTSTVSTISFRWAVKSSVRGLYVYLCDNVKCATIAANTSSTSGSGSTTALSGDSAKSNLAFSFYVPGNGSAINPPVYGGVNSVTVNYR